MHWLIKYTNKKCHAHSDIDKHSIPWPHYSSTIPNSSARFLFRSLFIWRLVSVLFDCTIVSIKFVVHAAHAIAVDALF